MSTDKPHFIARKFQNFQRQAARPLTCPLCTLQGQRFSAVPRLKDHAISLHQEVTDDFPDGPKWQAYLDQSKSAPKTFRKTATETPDAASGKDSDNESMKLHVDSQTQSQASYSRPVSGPVESFEGLSIGTGAAPSQPNPLKRPGDSSPQRRSTEIDPRTPPRNRRAKGPSGSSFAADRVASQVNRANGNKRLYDPHADVPFANSGANERSLLSRVDDFKHSNGTQKGHQPLQPLTPSSPVETSSKAPSPIVDEDYDFDTELLLQPETRPISHEQLVVEVKGIYAGLVMVEAKCIDVDDKQSQAAQERDPAKRTELSSEQWSALIALHKTLLHEHHDFLLASQHPAASPALSKLAAKYSMPARMWRHGIHAFLEVLRHRLPGSLDHMLAFIYIAYSMMALLYETVEAFQDTWIECLGDLGRYRMAIEDDDVRDREVWSGVARFWYGKAADRSPKVGRLCHHLAILSRPFTIQQLSLYCRSLSCIIPFDSARNSIMSIFTPVLEKRDSVYQRSNTTEVSFIFVHALLFLERSEEEVMNAVDQLLGGDLFSKFISRTGPKFKEIGASAAMANIAALHQYGATTKRGVFSSLLRLRFEEARLSQGREDTESTSQAREDSQSTSQATLQRVTNLSVQDQEKSLRTFSLASEIAFPTLSIALRRAKDRNVYPLVHAYIIYIWHATNVEHAITLLERHIPWGDLVMFLNQTINEGKNITERVRRPEFPGAANGGPGRPLAEDFVMRGHLHTEDYFPVNWFTDAKVDDEERVLDPPSFHAPRLERILWASYQIAGKERWITYDAQRCRFDLAPYARNISALDLTKVIESSAVSPDTVMAGTEDIDQPIQHTVDRPHNTDSTPIKQEPIEDDLPKKFQLSQAPKAILKRQPEPKPEPIKEDTRMSEPRTIKEEHKPNDPSTQEWLSDIKPSSPPITKSEHRVFGTIPQHFPAYTSMDQSKDP